jgi:hypothetical protein
MSKLRLPKQAYVRQLERLSLDLEQWAYLYIHDHDLAPHDDPRDVLLERAYALQEVARLVDEAIDQLRGVPRLS